MSAPFAIIKPIPITDSNFVSTTIAEDDYDAYVAETSYSIGDRVIVTTGQHKIYESLVDTNVGNTPSENPLSWADVSPTNAWAAFDSSGSTVSTDASPIEFVFTGDRIDGMAFLGLVATTVRIQASSTIDGTYYDKTYTLEDNAVVTNWYQYFYSDIERKEELVVNDIPPVGLSTYTVTITGGGSVSIGTFAHGRYIELGFSQYNATIGILDYSKKETDQFGKTVLKPGDFSETMSVAISMKNGAVDPIYKKLTALRAQEIVWIAAKGSIEALTIYGFYRDFSIDVAYFDESLCTLEIEGLT